MTTLLESVLSIYLVVIPPLVVTLSVTDDVVPSALTTFLVLVVPSELLIEVSLTVFEVPSELTVFVSVVVLPS